MPFHSAAALLTTRGCLRTSYKLVAGFLGQWVDFIVSWIQSQTNNTHYFLGSGNTQGKSKETLCLPFAKHAMIPYWVLGLGGALRIKDK